MWRWDARDDASWFFTSVPPELSADIREIPRPYRGFGSVRVRARIGGSEWSTSIFPDSERGAYVLPLKRAVRDAEGLAALRDQDRIAFTYAPAINGSVADIAGVLSANRRVLGMMPHPERAADPALGGTDGAADLLSRRRPPG